MKTTRSKSPASNNRSAAGKKKGIFRNGWLKLVLRVVKLVFIVFVIGSLFFVILYRFVNPPVTWLMIQRGFERKADGKDWKIDKQWKDFDDISLSMKRAAVAAEDQTFLENHGFDFNAIEKAYEYGVISWKKPISCHLYPIRITKYPEFDVLNYDRWSICSPACTFGNELKVHVHEFLKGPLIRKYGEEWYKELVEAVEAME